MNENNKKNRRILVIGEKKEAGLDEIEKALLGETKGLKKEEFVIDCAFQVEEGLKMVEESFERGEPYSVAFVDIRMPPSGMGGKR